MNHWAEDAVFYHLYPLGMCGAPLRNERAAAPEPRLLKLLPWFAHARDLGATALYSGSRLRIREPWLRHHRFLLRRSPAGDEGIVEGRCEGGARPGTSGGARRRLRARRPRVLGVPRPARARSRLAASRLVSGRRRRRLQPPKPIRRRLRLRALERRAGAAAPGPQKPSETKPSASTSLRRSTILGRAIRDRRAAPRLRRFARPRIPRRPARPLRAALARVLAHGGSVLGDYRRWAGPGLLHSATNYEVYKGLWSSHVDRNFFEIGYSLDRACPSTASPTTTTSTAWRAWSGSGLISFPFTVFFSRCRGSRRSTRGANGASPRPGRAPTTARCARASTWGKCGAGPGQDLCEAVARLIAVRGRSEALRRGDCLQLAVGAQQLAFLRRAAGQAVIVAVNAGVETSMSLSIPGCDRALLTDLLNPPARFEATGGKARIDVPGTWGRVLEVKRIA